MEKVLLDSNDKTQAVQRRKVKSQSLQVSETVYVTQKREAMPNRRIKFCTCCLLIAVIALVVTLTLVFTLGRGRASSGPPCPDLTPSKICSRDNPYPFYGTKTDYILAKTNLQQQAVPEEKHSCTAKQLYMFSRHAARFPDADKIDTMIKEFPKLISKILEANTQDPICEKFKEDLRVWNTTMKPSDDNNISPTGKKQAKELAERLQALYPLLLSRNYSKDNYEFGFTSRDRTKATALAFAQGLFKKDLPQLNNLPAQDAILQFHKACDDILKKKGWTKTKPEEIQKFKDGDIINTVISDMSARLGITLDFDTLKLMLSICQFEYSMELQSVWCPLFKAGYLKALEYLDDIDDYYQDAYGRERNYQQACPVVKHLLQKFGSVVNSTTNSPKAILMFSHAGAIKKVITRFGLFKDSRPLLATGFCSSQDRKWRSSLICPFNANIVFVLYECSGKHYVEALLQEKPVVLKGCSSSLCPWDTFLDNYNTVAENCDLNLICTT